MSIQHSINPFVGLTFALNCENLQMIAPQKVTAYCCHTMGTKHFFCKTWLCPEHRKNKEKDRLAEEKEGWSVPDLEAGLQWRRRKGKTLTAWILNNQKQQNIPRAVWQPILTPLNKLVYCVLFITFMGRMLDPWCPHVYPIFGGNTELQTVSGI